MHPEKADLCSFRGAIKDDLKILGLLSGMLLLTAVFTVAQQRHNNRSNWVMEFDRHCNLETKEKPVKRAMLTTVFLMMFFPTVTTR
jgi:hypothetical protein